MSRSEPDWCTDSHARCGAIAKTLERADSLLAVAPGTRTSTPADGTAGPVQSSHPCIYCGEDAGQYDEHRECVDASAEAEMVSRGNFPPHDLQGITFSGTPKTLQNSGIEKPRLVKWGMAVTKTSTRTVRLPGAFVGWLEGTHAWQLPDDPQNDPAVVRMVEAVKAGTTQTHGKRQGAYGESVAYSVLVEADDECLELLREYAGYLIDICQNGDDDPTARAELAAARKVWERVQ